MALETSERTRVGRNKILGIIAVLLIVLGISIVASQEAKADQEKVTITFTGFAFEKSVVTPSMKIQIARWLKANPGYSMVTCVGYTGQNVKNRTKAFIQKLAIARSKSICSYIHTKNGGIAVQSTRGIPGDGKTADARKVTVTLIKVDNSGGGTGGGTGNVTIGVCDRALTATMQSRILYGDFYFSKISIKDISNSCRDKLIDIYFLDADGNQITSVIGFTIYSTTITANYSSFSPREIKSDLIKTVAFEIRDK